jgi:hypothetical protein
LLNVGAVPNPRDWEHWPKAEAFLEPARRLGNFDTVLEDDEALYVAMDGDELIGCVTARLCEGFVEIPLIGGRDHLRWIPELDQMIGLAAHEAGAKWLQGWGRRGWEKTLTVLGWAKIKQDSKSNLYFRHLERNGNDVIVG